jgi:hypothetical protein
MIQMAKIYFLFLLPFLALTGCKPKEMDVWEDTKITDIPPATFDGLSGAEGIQTANFEIYIFEIPQENLGQLDEIWKMLNKRGVYFLDYRAFSSNSFQVGLGRAAMLESINEIIQEARGRAINRVTLLIPEGESEDVEAAFLNKPQSVFYSSVDGSMTGNTLGPGNIMMRLLAKDIPSLTGTSNVQFSVVFKAPSTALNTLEMLSERGEYLFTPVLFNVSMALDDLVILGPQELSNDPATLNGLFFGEDKKGSFFRIYVVSCIGVLF